MPLADLYSDAYLDTYGVPQGPVAASSSSAVTLQCVTAPAVTHPS